MTDQYDVIVLGSGMAGCATALAAAELKLKVLLLEKTERVGGGTALSWGGLWVGNNPIARRLGLSDSRDEALAYLRFIGGGATEDDHVQTYVDAAPIALQAFEDMGIRFQVTRGFPDHYYPVAPGSTAEGRHVEVSPTSAESLGEWESRIRGSFVEPHCLTCEEIIAWGGINNHKHGMWDHELVRERTDRRILGRGRGLIAQMLGALLKRGVTVQLGTGVTELLRTGNATTGVVTTGGASVQARLGVVLATGGYEGDPGLADCFEGLPGWRSMFPPGVDGDGMRLGTRLGGGVALMRNNLALFVGFTVPSPTADQAPMFRLSSICELLYPHTLVVNDRGERFADEAYFQDMAVALRHYDIWRRRFSNLPCYLIFDSQYVRNFSFSGRPPGETPPDWVARGATIAELAGNLGISAEGLERTVNRFNGFVAAGEDRDFQRGSKRWTLARKESFDAGKEENRTLGKLEAAPFYGIELSPSAFASAGLRTSTNANVLALDGTPIENLYAVGNAASHAEYGIGYQAGTSLGSAMTFGYLAAKAMAAK